MSRPQALGAFGSPMEGSGHEVHVLLQRRLRSGGHRDNWGSPGISVGERSFAGAGGRRWTRSCGRSRLTGPQESMTSAASAEWSPQAADDQADLAVQPLDEPVPQCPFAGRGDPVSMGADGGGGFDERLKPGSLRPRAPPLQQREGRVGVEVAGEYLPERRLSVNRPWGWCSGGGLSSHLSPGPGLDTDPRRG